MRKFETKNYQCSNLIIDDTFNIGDCSLEFKKEFLIPESKDGIGKPQLTRQSWNIIPDRNLPDEIFMEVNYIDIKCVNNVNGALYEGKGIVKNVKLIAGTGELKGF